MKMQFFNNDQYVVQFELSGELNAGVCAEQVGQMLQMVESSSAECVVLNLEEVNLLDSAGVGSLVFLFRRIRGQGRRMVLQGAIGQPRTLLKMLRIHRAIPMTDGALTSDVEERLFGRQLVA